MLALTLVPRLRFSSNGACYKLTQGMVKEKKVI